MKTALVTGGSRGIGLAIALELGRSGYAVAIMATKPESVIHTYHLKYLFDIVYHYYTG